METAVLDSIMPEVAEDLIRVRTRVYEQLVV